MLAAIYARKSTDDSDRNEEARSITRQVERATEYAKKKGWTVDPRYIFVDDAVTGGKVFGYVNHRDGQGYVRRVIDEAEAATVRRIFTMYAEGTGLTRIAKKLNAEGVPAPRGGSGSWAGTAIRDMLSRSLYRGVV